MQWRSVAWSSAPAALARGTRCRALRVSPVAIPTGARGEPVWPSGVAGSLTHCTGYRACTVARKDDLLSIGIDAEVNERLPNGVLEQVAFGQERARLASGSDGICLDKVPFSAKEAIYKAWHPLAGRWLGFEDVDLTIDIAGRGFHARLLVPGPLTGSKQITRFHGRWDVELGIVAATTVVETSPPVNRRASLDSSSREAVASFTSFADNRSSCIEPPQAPL
ncbi:MAG TPA: 4'-phosphopantetheinyl transferase superfamily protein [Solirubrobacteraceae bacterium]|jgi:4'-phosphopantetheinyl transferase EntD